MEKLLNSLRIESIRWKPKQQTLRNVLLHERLRNKELTTVCQRQQLLIDEQSGMIVEMLEGMGK